MKKLTLLLVAFLLAGCGGGGGGDATNGSVPVIEVAAPTAIDINGATLNGDVIPNGLSTQVWFEYGPDPSLSSFAVTTQQSVGSGLTKEQVFAQVGGLAENTKYYYRVCASNSKGESDSSVASFTTSFVGVAPAVATLAATAVGANTATLNGNVTPNGLPTDAWFEWGTDSALSSFGSTASQSVGSGTTGQPVNAALTGLAAGAAYYYRVAATNSAGTLKGTILAFTPSAAPAVSTVVATSISATGATLNGNVTPNGQATAAWFEWGTSATLSSYNTTTSMSAAGGTSAQPVTAPLTGLSAGATYYFRVAAGNATGTSKGSILQFTASDPSPLVTVFSDDFSADTTGSYVVFTSLGTGTFTYDPSGQNAKVIAGNGETVIFSRLLPTPTNYSGVFSLDFSPASDYGSGGNVAIRVMDTPTTYYELSTKNASVRKVRKGVAVDEVAFPFPYSQGGTYPVKITFSPAVTTVEAFGGTVDLIKNDSANPIVYFEVESTQQDAYYDNIKLETAP
ncbi:MAG: fibronectin type III domain-containing protein [Deltaproteobacteria bacterium]|nr:fibronectin type III domain-containing protein [Deltaproteobacteria bacterium]